MRKLIPGNYNIICKGKSGQLIETSPGLGPATPRDRIFSIIPNNPAGVFSDGSYIYFSTYAWGVCREASYRIYKYSIVDAERIWTTRLIYVYHGTNDTFAYYGAGRLFVLGNYVYLQKSSGTYQRYLKSDGSKYGVEFQGELNWGSNCFVDGNYAYSWSTGHTAFIKKFDSNLNQVGSVELLAPAGTPIEWEFPTFFMLAWDGTRLCGGGRWEYDGGDWGKGAFATWSLSGGTPTNTWICVNPWGQEMTPTSGCSGHNIIIGNEIWSLGELHDGDRIYDPERKRYRFTLNPEKNAMYYNANWRLTCIHWPYIHSSQPGNYDFYKYGSFHRGRYGEGFSYNHIEKQIAKHGDKLYVTLSPYGPGSHADLVGVHEMTTGGVYQNVHLV